MTSNHSPGVTLTLQQFDKAGIYEKTLFHRKLCMYISIVTVLFLSINFGLKTSHIGRPNTNFTMMPPPGPAVPGQGPWKRRVHHRSPLNPCLQPASYGCHRLHQSLVHRGLAEACRRPS